VVMLEEPQAAFYAWLAANQADWRARVAAHPLVLVVDVGGGTTDLSLIAARTSRGELGLERVAVGEHLLLGGDNIDLALARALEARLFPSGGQLDPQRFHGLVSQCRAAKERLLGDPTLAEVRLAVPGRGGAVIGGALAASLARAEVEATVPDRLFPRVEAAARPRRGAAPAPRARGPPLAPAPARPPRPRRAHRRRRGAHLLPRARRRARALPRAARHGGGRAARDHGARVRAARQPARLLPATHGDRPQRRARRRDRRGGRARRAAPH